MLCSMRTQTGTVMGGYIRYAVKDWGSRAGRGCFLARPCPCAKRGCGHTNRMLSDLDT